MKRVSKNTLIKRGSAVSAERLEFSKLSGSGNDFILIDNRSGVVRPERLPELTQRICRRRFSVGADGLIAIEDSEKADFRWRFHNADGSEAEMCGNGGRCAARFAFVRGICGPRASFETLAGIIHAEVKGRRVKLELLAPEGLQKDIVIPLDSVTIRMDAITIGVPHVVIYTEDLEGWDVCQVGRSIRFHPLFQPEGTNVNFVWKQGPSEISVRTYERGVEGETLACGTGSVASALVGALRYGIISPVLVNTRGGEILDVYFKATQDVFHDVFLEGETTWVCDGHVLPEAL
jgi:diaminopimelate epimerase